jgi:UDP-N-acetylglucosamine 2-epimerase (non-hydrolysing)
MRGYDAVLKFAVVAGARPNFVKVAPLMEAFKRAKDAQAILVHTGQHYDHVMSAVFFQDLDMPTPDVYLKVGSGTHAEQTAKVLVAFEDYLMNNAVDCVVVVGDVNSTLACALAAAKCHVPLAHVEAGLRSFDRTMPEEVNRVVTDALADYLFTPSKDGDENLAREGAPGARVFQVGNVMIDTLRRYEKAARARSFASRHGLRAGEYILCTLHRPSNVDHEETFRGIVSVIRQLSQKAPVIFPVHPRTQSRMSAFGLQDQIRDNRLLLIDPLGYLDFLSVLADAGLVLTDSGGIQEETTVLGIPCLTLRESTERPVTVTVGTNRVVGTDAGRILESAETALAGNWIKGSIPDGWDGHTAERIVQLLTKEKPSLAGRKQVSDSEQGMPLF